MIRQMRLPRIVRVATVIVAGVLTAAACSSSASESSSQTTPTVTAPAPSVPTPANLAVAHVSAVARQTIRGFGASGAWWPIDLASFPGSVRQSVAKMLFSSDGIALSGYRYNIGGGGAGVTTVDRAPKELSADVAGLYFLRAAAADGVPILTGFVNSAPPRFTTNGKACGGDLKPGMEAAYAQYLAGVVATLHDRDHVTLQYVSPMNEPDNAFGDCGQEGMRVPVAQRAAVVQALGTELARRAPYAQVIADETTADAVLSTEAPQWLSVPGTAPYVAAIAHHTYDFPDDTLRKLVPPISAKFHTPTWMTEICCYKGSGGVASSFGANYDPTMTQGFWLADQIESDFTVAGDERVVLVDRVVPCSGLRSQGRSRVPHQGEYEGLQRRVAVLRPTRCCRWRHQDLHDQALLCARPVQSVCAPGCGAPRRRRFARGRAHAGVCRCGRLDGRDVERGEDGRAVRRRVAGRAGEAADGRGDERVGEPGLGAGFTVAPPNGYRFVAGEPPRRNDRDLHLLEVVAPQRRAVDAPAGEYQRPRPSAPLSFVTLTSPLSSS